MSCETALAVASAQQLWREMFIAKPAVVLWLTMTQPPPGKPMGSSRTWDGPPCVAGTWHDE